MLILLLIVVAGSRRPFSQEPTQASEFIKQIFSASPPLPPPPREPTVMSPLGQHRVQEWVVPSTTAVDPAATAKNISSTDFYNWFMCACVCECVCVCVRERERERERERVHKTCKALMHAHDAVTTAHRLTVHVQVHENRMLSSEGSGR